MVTGRRYTSNPGGGVQLVVPSGLVVPVYTCSVPSPSVTPISLLDTPAIVSALLGWISSGVPNRVRLETASDQLFPAGEREWSSRPL